MDINLRLVLILFVFLVSVSFSSFHWLLMTLYRGQREVYVCAFPCCVL